MEEIEAKYLCFQSPGILLWASLALLENVGCAGIRLTLQDEPFSKSSQSSETFLQMTLNIVSLVLEGQDQGYSIKKSDN